MSIEADSLCVTRSGKEVLNAVSFSVQSGEIYALLGGNGAGKSTTLLSFLGFLSPASGKVLVQGKSVQSNVAEARQNIAYLPESVSLYEHLSAFENLDYFLKLAGIPAEQSRIEAALDEVSLLPDARRQRLSTYSKGMRQKVAIALAVLKDANILLLDEPTSGLDPNAIDELHQIIRRLADRDKTILMVTHDLYGACQVANKVGLLQQGRLVGEFSDTETAGQSTRIDIETVRKAFSSEHYRASDTDKDLTNSAVA